MSGLPTPSAASDARWLTFSHEDLVAFADASGDRNPLHLDARFARRTPFGACVVHGSLLTLGALGCLPAEALARVRTVEASFGGAVLVDEPVQVETRSRPDAWELRLSGRGRLLARVVARAEARKASSPRTEPPSDRAMRLVPQNGEAVRVGENVAGAYASAPALVALAAALHSEALDAALLEALAWASYIVGMEVPGLHGVFAAATLSVVDRAGGAAQSYSLVVREHDPRTEQLVLEGSLELHGVSVGAVLECFARPPVPQLDAEGVLPASPLPPSGASMVVIGGSRGFGAAATLALLARGHEAHAVFSTAGDQVEELQRVAGPHAERLALHRADAREPAELAPLLDVLASRGAPLRGLVLAAAAPPLPMSLTAASAATLADYVADAIRLVAGPLGALLPLLDDGAFILFCSSAAVEAPPRDWPHYVAAKGAIEGLAAWASAAAPGVRVVVARLPKMLTGMTNSPSMRLGAVAPEVIAGRLVGRLESGEFPAGLTIVGFDE